MIRIGTRGSKLALWQANDLKDQLASIDIQSELVIIKTKGDLIQHLSFDKIEGKGFFTKEIEDSLIADEIDIAVHSLKDLPTTMLGNLTIGALSTRADARDVLISHKNVTDRTRLLKIANKAKVGTSSVRRKVQLRHFDHELQIVDVRGNVPTRVNKVREGQVDAIVIAAAGIDRLDLELSDLNVLRFNPTEFVPAPAQGVIAYQCRKSDKKSIKILRKIHKADVAACTNIERKILNLLDGGCQLPLGAYCTRDANGHFHCNAVLGDDDGQNLSCISYSSSTSSGMANHVVNLLTNQV